MRSATADLDGKPSKLCSSGDADLARVLAKICNTQKLYNPSASYHGDCPVSATDTDPHC